MNPLLCNIRLVLALTFNLEQNRKSLKQTSLKNSRHKYWCILAQPMPGLSGYAGLTGRWGLLPHAKNWHTFSRLIFLVFRTVSHMW